MNNYKITYQTSSGAIQSMDLVANAYAPCSRQTDFFAFTLSNGDTIARIRMSSIIAIIAKHN